MKYPAIIEGGENDYGIYFPDLPGIVAMGNTVEQVKLNAEEALRDYALEADRDGLALTPPSPVEDVEVPGGCTLTCVALVRSSAPA